MQNAFNMSLLELIKLKNASAAKTLLRLSEDVPQCWRKYLSSICFCKCLFSEYINNCCKTVREEITMEYYRQNWNI